jgi:hypothetical protein
MFKIQALMMFAILLVNAQTTNTPITKPQIVVVPTVLVPIGNPGMKRRDLNFEYLDLIEFDYDVK